MPPGGDVEGTWSIIYKRAGDEWNPIVQLESWLTGLALDASGRFLAVDMDGRLHSDRQKKRRTRPKPLNCSQGLNALWVGASRVAFAVGNLGEEFASMGERFRSKKIQNVDASTQFMEFRKQTVLAGASSPAQRNSRNWRFSGCSSSAIS